LHKQVMETSSSVVTYSNLTRWGEATTDEREQYDDFKTVKFAVRPDLNSKIVLWLGDIREIDTDVVVNPTNEAMSDKSGISGIILEAAGPETLEEITKLEACRTGEARICKSYNLPSRYIIHTVGPRYNDKYRTAAENALHSCYRSCLELLKENHLTSITFPVVNSQKRGYPPEQGAHIAIRTVRRFLEHWGKDIQSVVFCVNPEEYKLYSKILPLYFPRDRKELQISKDELPRDTGNEFGETVIENRIIRIKPSPVYHEPVHITASPISTPVSTPREEKLPNSFSMMQSDFDEERKKKLEQLSQAEKERIEQQQLYLNCLYKAQKMDLSDIARLSIIYESGRDTSGRPIVVIVGSRLPMQRNYLDRVFLYMIKTMDKIVDHSYTVVYLHTKMEDKDTPEFSWMKQVYNIMDYKYGDHLSNFYIVHPTFWLKMFETLMSTFVTSNFFTKVKYISKLDELYDFIDPEQLVIPEEVYQYDVSENGASSRQPKRMRETKVENLLNDL